MNIKQGDNAEIAKKEAKIRKIVSWICYASAGLTAASILFGLFDFFQTGFLIFIFIGLALIFEQLSRKVFIQKNLTPEEAGMVIQKPLGKKLEKKTVSTYKKILNEDINENVIVKNKGKDFADEIEKASHLINDEQISNDLRDIKENVFDIFDAASKDESIEKQIRKFNAIYLPMTLKLLNIYINLNNKRVQTKSVKELKTEITAMIDKVKDAFCRLNNDLFEQATIDVEAEIEALKNVLTIDGLLADNELHIPVKK